MTFYLERTHLTALLWALRDDPSLRFELLSSLSGVDYGAGFRAGCTWSTS